MGEQSVTSVNPLEQFVLLAKNAKGAAAVELIKQALEAPGVFVFGELLDMPNIQVNLITFVTLRVHMFILGLDKQSTQCVPDPTQYLRVWNLQECVREPGASP